MLTRDWVVPGYTELHRLGAGGFGEVVLARHEASGAFAAIKYLFGQHLGDPERLAAFRREAEMLSRVRSPHIARLHEFHEGPHGAAIVMEAIHGVSLREVLGRDGVLAPESALAVLKGSLLGLADAHRAGVVHRDYKPANVLVGPGRESKLVDFGVATLAGRAGLPVGTPPYMAPEQWRGAPASPATDVYAATCVFFQAITGRQPYVGTTTGELQDLHEHAPVPAHAAPAPVRGLITRGMAKDSGQRPSTAAEFVAELEAAAVAGYGPDWEQRGLGRLAQRAGALLALSPLALLGAGTAAAPGAASGLAAAGTGMGLGAKIGAALVAVAVGAGAVAGTVAVLGHTDTPPPVVAAPAVEQQTAMQVSLETRREAATGPAFHVDAQYVHVSGMRDQALQDRINAQLVKPLDDFTGYVRAGLADPTEDPAITGRAEFHRRTDRVLSVRYDLMAASSQFGNHGGYTTLWLDVDLRTGEPITPGDVFAGIADSQAAMSALESRILRMTPGGYCDGSPPLGERVPLAPRDLRPWGVLGTPALQLGFREDAVVFGVSTEARGYPMACGYQEVVVAYSDVADLMTPLGRELLS
ncbi:serine/threonine-protein kinase [Amycolatopsis viridis]|uniref:Serine/threonine-protein kinase n=1 Tax=Amycolatopsis viridis TaxID=185678 RepID=A0ABX0SM16_9PSEU|nr:serine/threonine-protein kinase [Amycolatopsis viridis]NIH77589.1 serine/threonine-protein kinase [Amycolatopsis viridis]